MGVALNFPNQPVEGDVVKVEGADFAFLEGVWRRNPAYQGEVAVPPGVTMGDVKQSFQASDHGGWVKLDGRAVSALPTVQKDNAIALGFTANLPDAGGAFLCQDSGVMGAITGSCAKKITQAMLPAVNLTAASAGASTPTTSSAGAATPTSSEALNFSDEVGQQGPRGQAGVGGSGYWFIACGDEGGANMTAIRDYKHSHTMSVPAHSHTVSVPAHTHVVALGGSGADLDVTPKRMSVNHYVYLGS